MKAPMCSKCNKARLVVETDLSGRCSGEKVQWYSCRVCGDLIFLDRERRVASVGDWSPGPVFTNRKDLL